MDMTHINGCSMSNCAYNEKMECHTLAITVGPHAECNTFVHASAKGGLSDARGGIGACLASDCKFNNSLECAAAGIDVSDHNKHADCTTFSKD